MHLSKLATAALLALAAMPAASEAPAHADAAQPAKAKPSPAAGKQAPGPVRTVEIAVTSEGFVPAEVTAKPGETLKLAVTRRTDKTCATEIVMKDFGVNQPLPLDRTVFVTVKPAKPGTYRYACGMDMVTGALVVK